jgi:HAD superfamily hydrolase (TIGR01549 family)
LAAAISAPRPGAPRAVTFDAGFTLIEPIAEPAALVERVVGRTGARPSAAAIAAALADSAPILAAPSVWWADAERAAAVLRRYYATVLDHLGHRARDAAAEVLREYVDPGNWRACPGMVDLLTTLRSAGWRLGVLSNWQPSLSETLAEAGLADHLDAVVASTVAGTAKPDGEAYAAAAAALAVAVGEVVHVGDHLGDDVAGALLGGGRAVYVDGPFAGLAEAFETTVSAPTPAPRRAAPGHPAGTGVEGTR